MRTHTSRAAMMGALVFCLAGCQLITGTFNVEGTTASASCSTAASCCQFLTGNQAMLCASYVTLGDQQVCAAFLDTFPNGTCLATTDPDAGQIIFPDAGMTRHDGGTVSHMDANVSGQDASEGHDVFVGTDSSSPVDAGQDTSTSDPLEGTWTLGDIQCEGESLGLGDAGMLVFSGTTVQQEIEISDGCVITTTLNPATVGESDILGGDASESCGADCTPDDECTSGDIGTVDEPYTLSGGTLTITLPDNTGTCSSGTLQYLWTQI